MINIENILSVSVILILIYCAVKHIVILSMYPRTRHYKAGTQTDQIPSEDPTPAQAAFVYFYNKNIMKKDIMPNVIVAMLFDLVKKGCIQMEKENHTITMTLAKDTDLEILNEEEQIMFHALEMHTDKQTRKMTLDQLANYMRKDSIAFGKTLSNIVIKAKVKAEQDGKYREKDTLNVEKYICMAVIYTMLGFMSLLFTNVVVLIAVFNGLLCSLIANRLNNLTLKGMDEKNEWMAVEEYLRTLPHKDVRTIPSLLDLETYYIYMITFGKEKLMGKTIQTSYPHLVDLPEGQNYTFMHILYQDSYFLKEIKEQIEDAYQEVYKENKRLAPNMFK